MGHRRATVPVRYLEQRRKLPARSLRPPCADDPKKNGPDLFGAGRRPWGDLQQYWWTARTVDEDLRARAGSRLIHGARRCAGTAPAGRRRPGVGTTHPAPRRHRTAATFRRRRGVLHPSPRLSSGDRVDLRLLKKRPERSLFANFTRVDPYHRPGPDRACACRPPPRRWGGTRSPRAARSRAPAPSRAAPASWSGSSR